MSPNKSTIIMEDFNCDITHILETRDFSVFQKIESHCYNFRAKIAAKIDDAIAYKNEKRTLCENQILELQQEIEGLKSEIDATKLQQRVVDKKFSNATTQQSQLQEEVQDAKSKRDSLSLEMVDLKQDYEKRQTNKVAVWNAIKRACLIYKQCLDFRIDLPDNAEQDCIQIIYFIHNENLNGKYFCRIIESGSTWKVEEIQPILEKEHYNDFKGIVDFSTHSEIVDITAFLYKLRHIFMKHYLKVK